ncbi:MAG: anaerobic ribonucleoside-triphosphate reductase activating protein [Candidatus Moranbacteria bacterium]|nr:anaerobic ribonucleoside-triphosphate reductase activating protein [Candidatus Moranbacteria bacterium]
MTKTKLQIGGLEPASMLERKGNISSIIFVLGCNYRCGFCHNPELVFNTKGEIQPYPHQEVLKILKSKKNWIDSVIFTGGEPTIYQGLPNFMHKVKNLDLSIGLHTNGTNPKMIEEILEQNLLDYLAMDVKNHLAKYTQTVGLEKINLDSIKQSIQLVLQTQDQIQTVFRTTVVPNLIQKKDLPKIGRLIKGAKKACLQQFRPLRCLDKKFEKIQPYDKLVLDQMADILEQYVETVDRDYL